MQIEREKLTKRRPHALRPTQRWLLPCNATNHRQVDGSRQSPFMFYMEHTEWFTTTVMATLQVHVQLADCTIIMSCDWCKDFLWLDVFQQEITHCMYITHSSPSHGHLSVTFRTFLHCLSKKQRQQLAEPAKRLQSDVMWAAAMASDLWHTCTTESSDDHFIVHSRSHPKNSVWTDKRKIKQIESVLMMDSRLP